VKVFLTDATVLVITYFALWSEFVWAQNILSFFFIFLGILGMMSFCASSDGLAESNSVEVLEKIASSLKDKYNWFSIYDYVTNAIVWMALVGYGWYGIALLAIGSEIGYVRFRDCAKKAILIKEGAKSL